jgi:N-acetylglutamate synthase-like GNAT family acetyltransferase
VIIREAADGDASSLASLLGQLGYPADARDLPRRLKRLAERGTAVAFVAEVEDRVVGVATAHAFASIHAERDVAWLTTLVVAQDARHRGVGRALVAAAEGWARDHSLASG